MSKYKPVPDWWYLGIFSAYPPHPSVDGLTESPVSMFTFGVIVIEIWPVQLPVWALILALIIGESRLLLALMMP